MSVSCVGTCSHCGRKRFWLSDTYSLQLDDGHLECLRHPRESYDCERHGLTLRQANERNRLYRETFYVCRACGRDGEAIERAERSDAEHLDPWLTFTVRGAMKWCWGSAVIVVPLFVWLRWWETAVTVGGALVASPAIYWRENRKIARAIAARGLPRADAPGRVAIPPPTAGCRGDEFIVGQIETDEFGKLRATGPCCDKPDWIAAYTVKDEDRVPCHTCGRGLMLVSEWSIH
jgi:hypothetical protein